MKPPLAINWNAAGPDTVQYFWQDTAGVFIARGGITWPGELSVNGTGVVVVRDVKTRKAAVVMEWTYRVVKAIATIEQGLIEPGVLAFLVRARSKWGCTRMYYRDHDATKATWTRKIREAQEPTDTGMMYLEATWQDESAALALIADWMNRRELYMDRESLVGRELRRHESTPGMPLQPITRALACALNALDRRGTAVENPIDNPYEWHD